MAITSVKIHPAIGIARLGNSPDDFFVGPERLWDPPDPQGGFKDGSCRVKRQAARFRVYAYNDDGSVDEVTAAEADIEWTLHLLNKKAVLRNAGSAGGLTIDPGPRQVTGPDQRTEFDNGQITLPGSSPVTVPLGEIRTDDNGRLLVLGGFGTSSSPTSALISSFLDNEGWYDDVSDGPITAHVKMHASGDEFDAEGAWVICAPPKFAPQFENVISLYDTLFQLAVDQGWLAAPAVPSYTDDVFPILERARTTRWVIDIFGAHVWPDPVYDPADRQAIFTRLANPSGGGGNMPQLQSATLTKAQYAVMEKWRDDNFSRDWAGAPAPQPITPDGLDAAALRACVGAAFYPGIEAGGIAGKPIIDASNYVGAGDPMRLDYGSVAPGDMTEYMALPWQADFWACGSQWWPVPRPNDVIPEGTTSSQAWARDVGSYLEMVNEWHTLGFVVRQGNEYVEVDRCDTTFITLLTPHLTFQDVPQGPMGMPRKTTLAIAFEVKSTGAAVTLEVQPGEGPTHPRLVLYASSATVGPTAGNEIATARLWLVYETGPVNEMIVDQLTVRHLASGRSWTIAVTANTVARRLAAAALVLDRSLSMSEDRGDGETKIRSLREAASVFVDVMLEDDGVGLVRYNQDAQPLEPITALGPADDPLHPARGDTKDRINGPDLTPSGATSIGDGIYEGRQLLNAAGDSYDVRALVVLTDGNENRERWISEVAAEINEQTYAIGLGKPENTSAPALQTISGNNGGYLLVTGPITSDNRFVLMKYFLQILAGISNADVVLDPDGVLVPGQEQQIPFQLTEADAGVDVILLTPSPQAVDFRLQTPNGLILEPWRALAEPGMAWRLSQGAAYYRIVLPAELVPARYDHPGTWRALLSIGRPRLAHPEDAEVRRVVQPELSRRIPPRTGPEGALGRAPLRAPAAGVAAEAAGRFAAIGAAAAAQERRRLPFSLLVHTYSNLSMRATHSQTGFDPGATVQLEATIAEAGVPVQPGASVWAEVTRPSGTSTTVTLAEVEPGRFEGSFATTAGGVYRCRVRASGRSRAGYPFQREQTLTPVVWRGGDRDASKDPADGARVVDWLQERDERLCRLLACVLSEDGELTPELEQGLRRAGVDLRRLRRCLAAYCRPKREPVEDKPASSEERATAAELSSLLAAWQRPRDETEGGCRG